MAVILNASTSSGLVTTADNSGQFAFQSNGTQFNPLLTSGTSQNSTSGTAITFTGIPSWAKRITVMLNGVSTNGTNNILLQVGSGSLTTSGYNSIGGGSINGLAPAVNNSSTGFLLFNDTATDVRSGNIVINLLSNYVYICSYVLGGASTRNVIWWGAGSISLGGALDRVSLITTSTDTFDAGSVNILYE